MSEKNEKSDTSEGTESQESENEPIVVKVGYDQETRQVRFKGVELADATSHQGPNQNRWHTWTLYKVPGGDRYRVLDAYHTCWQGECGHVRLSGPLTALMVARKYPRLASYLGDEAVEDVDGEGDVDGTPDDDQ